MLWSRRAAVHHSVRFVWPFCRACVETSGNDDDGGVGNVEEDWVEEAIQIWSEAGHLHDATKTP